MKVIALTIVCIISSCNPLFANWSAFSLPGIPVWAGIQLIVGLCDNLDAASLMSLVIVFKSSFLLFSMFTTVKEYVCFVVVLVPPIVLMRVGDMPVSQWSIHFVVSYSL